MSNTYNWSATSHSPPPLQHPVPTHPSFIPEPPSTPASPQGYMRFSSAAPPSVPGPQQQQQQHQPLHPAPPPMFSSAPQQHPHHQPPHSQPPYSTSPPQGYGVPPQYQGTNFANFAVPGLNPATAQFGMQLGQSAVAAGQDYVQRNFGGLPVPVVKHHFNVSNSYVMQKLRLILFPWRHRRWTRGNKPEQGQAQWLPPRDDLNSPDLYIPVMAIVTYILLAALYSGLQDRFHPEVLGMVASRALAIVLIEFVFVKIGCYLLNITGSSQVTDLVAYGGYKFVGVIATLLIGLLKFGRTVSFVTFAYFFAANGFFLLRALKYVVLPDPRDTSQHVGTLSPAQRTRRIWFLFAIAATQVIYMWILVQV